MSSTWKSGMAVAQYNRCRAYAVLVNTALTIATSSRSLVRKPGAFAQYRYREDLFPRVIFRVAYDLLHETTPASADRTYVRLLELATREGEEAVAETLRELVMRGEAITLERVTAALTHRSPLALTANFAAHVAHIAPVVLACYDRLLPRGSEEVRG